MAGWGSHFSSFSRGCSSPEFRAATERLSRSGGRFTSNEGPGSFLPCGRLDHRTSSRLSTGVNAGRRNSAVPPKTRILIVKLRQRCSGRSTTAGLAVGEGLLGEDGEGYGVGGGGVVSKLEVEAGFGGGGGRGGGAGE